MNLSKKLLVKESILSIQFNSNNVFPKSRDTGVWKRQREQWGGTHLSLQFHNTESILSIRSDDKETEW